MRITFSVCTVLWTCVLVSWHNRDSYCWHSFHTALYVRGAIWSVNMKDTTCHASKENHLWWYCLALSLALSVKTKNSYSNKNSKSTRLSLSIFFLRKDSEFQMTRILEQINVPRLPIVQFQKKHLHALFSDNKFQVTSFDSHTCGLP